MNSNFTHPLDAGIKKLRYKRPTLGSSLHGSVITNLTSIHEDSGLIPGLAQWVKDLVYRSQMHLNLAWLWLWLWLWCTAPTGPLAWELLYAMGTALKKIRKRKMAHSTGDS